MQENAVHTHHIKCIRHEKESTKEKRFGKNLRRRPVGESLEGGIHHRDEHVEDEHIRNEHPEDQNVGSEHAGREPSTLVVEPAAPQFS